MQHTNLAAEKLGGVGCTRCKSSARRACGASPSRISHYYIMKHGFANMFHGLCTEWLKTKDWCYLWSKAPKVAFHWFSSGVRKLLLVGHSYCRSPSTACLCTRGATSNVQKFPIGHQPQWEPNATPRQMCVIIADGLLLSSIFDFTIALRVKTIKVFNFAILVNVDSVHHRPKVR